MFLTDKPGPPESFRPTEITENSVTLKWAEPNNTGGCDITGYHLEQKNGGARARWQKVQSFYPPQIVAPTGQSDKILPNDLTFTKLELFFL